MVSNDRTACVWSDADTQARRKAVLQSRVYRKLEIGCAIVLDVYLLGNRLNGENKTCKNLFWGLPNEAINMQSSP